MNHSSRRRPFLVSHGTSVRLVTAIAGCALLVGCGSSSDETTQTSPTTLADTTPAPPSTAVVADDLDGRIVFTRAGGVFGDETIFMANADGTDERQLTEYNASCCVRASVDGASLLYSALADDGQRVTTAIRQLADDSVRSLPLPDDTANLGPGAWSPDGARVALQLWDETDPSRDGIYTARASDGGDLRRVSDAVIADIPADYAPDGTELLIFREGSTQGVGELFVVDVEGSGEPVRISPEGMLAGFGSARYSPDGSRIAFNEGRTSATGALWTVGADGSQLTKLFEDPDGRFVSHPTWSPDGSMIMFALNPVADEFDHRPNGLYVIDADGSNLRLVLGGDDFKREPQWFD